MMPYKPLTKFQELGTLKPSADVAMATVNRKAIARAEPVNSVPVELENAKIR